MPAEVFPGGHCTVFLHGFLLLTFLSKKKLKFLSKSMAIGGQLWYNQEKARRLACLAGFSNEGQR